MDFLQMYRDLQEKGVVSPGKIESLMQSYKTWLATDSRPITYPYGIVYYADGILCSMPFQIRALKPLGIEMNGVFYLNRCLKVEPNPDFPAWDDGFVFAEYPRVSKDKISGALDMLKKLIWLEYYNWGDIEPPFKLELPTVDEILALSVAVRGEGIYPLKNLFFNGCNYWLKPAKSAQIGAYEIISPHLPGREPISSQVPSDGKDFTALVMPVVHKGKHTFIGRLNEFEVADAKTLQMYAKLIAFKK